MYSRRGLKLCIGNLHTLQHAGVLRVIHNQIHALDLVVVVVVEDHCRAEQRVALSLRLKVSIALNHALRLAVGNDIIVVIKGLHVLEHGLQEGQQLLAVAAVAQLGVLSQQDIGFLGIIGVVFKVFL